MNKVVRICKFKNLFINILDMNVVPDDEAFLLWMRKLHFQNLNSAIDIDSGLKETITDHSFENGQ